MDDKQQLEVEGVRRVKTSHISISLLILSLTLAATASCLIYVAVRDNSGSSSSTPAPAEPMRTQYRPAQRHQNYQREVPDETMKKPSVKDEAQLNVRNEDGSEITEDVEYDEDTDVATFKGSDGSFFAEDFEKGINVLEDPATGNCYVIPVGTNKTAGEELKTFIKGYHGEQINMELEDTYKVMVLPGAIEDTSFLPAEAVEYCSNFHWLSVVSDDDNDGDNVGDREKRAVCRLCARRLLYYYRINGVLYGRYRYVCYYYTC